MKTTKKWLAGKYTNIQFYQDEIFFEGTLFVDQSAKTKTKTTDAAADCPKSGFDWQLSAASVTLY